MKLFKHLLAVILGAASFVFLYGICTIIIEFIGNIPVIGRIMYYPSDASWALIAIPAPTAVFVAACISTKIVNTAKPISTIMAVFWILNIVCMFAFQTFTWAEIFRSLFGVGASCFCFGMDEDGEVKNYEKKSYIVVDKETGEVVDEEYRPK